MQQTPYFLEITLFGTMTMCVLVPGTERRYPVHIDEVNPKHQVLLAYLALRQGEDVPLNALRQAMNERSTLTMTQVQEAFNMGKRDVRQKIAQALKYAQRDGDFPLFPAKLEIFEREGGKRYRLPPYCRVSDLTVLDAQYAVLTNAIDQQQLLRDVPNHVFEACKLYIAAYTGNFLETLLAQYPSAIENWTKSWIREPYTSYKHRYLTACFYAGEYLRQHASQAMGDPLKVYHEAAGFFARGALAVCNDVHVFDGLFDTFVSFSDHPGLEQGVHVLLGEQLLRNALVCYMHNGSTMLAYSLYGRYQQHMLRVSNGVWRPSAETTLVLHMIGEPASNVQTV